MTSDTAAATAPATARATSDAAALARLRATRSLLFSDIEGSSRLEQAIGTDAYASIRGRHRDILRAGFSAHGGLESGTEGDSFFVVFEGADDAVAAAIDIQRALAAEPWPPEATVRVRIGIHSGDVATVDGDFVGIAINRAARIAAAAHGGQIVVSEATRTLALAAGHDFQDLGLHRLKDFEPMRLFQVQAEGLVSSFPPLRSAAAFGSLPLQATSFVGRAEEVEAIRSLLREHRLVTLTGPGGTGKTRLSMAAAQAAAHDVSDGVAWVGLSPIDDPGLVAAAIASAVGAIDSGTLNLRQLIVQRIGSSRILLVLDNFEQVAPAAPLVSELLGECPGLRVLVTSRGALHLAGEQEYPVSPLSVPSLGPEAGLDPADLLRSEAIALFVERARAVRPDFELTPEAAAAVVAICTRLEGLPLAIELAAARIRLLSPAAIRDRLDRSLGLLTGGASDLPSRQRTLRGAVAWSHDLLDRPAQTLFARLSAFAGGWSLEAAETVCDPDGSLGVELLDGLSALVDQSLVRPVDVASGETRFRMLHVIREFGLEQLAAAGELSDLRDRHLRFFADLADRAEPELIGRDTGRWLDRLETEHDNIRSALRWALESGDLQRGLAMAGQLWRFWHQRGHLGEGLDMTRALLDCPEARVPTWARAKALNGAGGLTYWQNDFPAATSYYEEQLELVRSLGDKPGIAEALLNLGYMAAIAGDYPKAIERYTDSVRISTEIGDLARESAAQLGLGMVHSLNGDLDAGWRAAERARDIGEEVGERYWVNSANGVLGRIATQRGDVVSGFAHTTQAMAGFAEVGDGLSTAMEVWDVAELAVRAGRPERALVLAAASDRVRERLAGGAPTVLSRAMDVVGEAAPLVGEQRTAELMAIGQRLTLEEAVAFAASDADLPPTVEGGS